MFVEGVAVGLTRFGFLETIWFVRHFGMKWCRAYESKDFVIEHHFVKHHEDCRACAYGSKLPLVMLGFWLEASYKRALF